MKKIAYSLIIALLLFSCSNEQVSKETKEIVSKSFIEMNAAQIKNAGIKEGFIERKLIGYTVNANGTIEVPAQNKSVVTVPFGGFVKSLEVLDGMQVKKGQTLLIIEHPELIQIQQDYLEVIGNIEFLEAEFQRQKSLSDKEAGSLKSMQMAKSQYNASIAQKNGLTAKLDLAGVNLAQLRKGDIQRSIAVKSPMNGVVTKLNVKVGAYADPMNDLMEIIDLDHARAEITIFEKDIRHLKTGQRIELRFSDIDDLIDAKVFLIGKEIGKDRTVKVYGDLEKKKTDIAPGSYFKASIHTDAVEQYCVPNGAVAELNNKKVLFFVEEKSKGGSKFTPEEIEVLGTENGLTAFRFVNNNLSYDKKVVLSNAYDIMSAILIQEEE